MELIRTAMTPLERAKAYAAGEEVDRIPTTLSEGETIPPLYGYKMHDYYFSADVMVDVESRMIEDFDSDNAGMGLGLRTMVEALGTELAYPDNSVSYIVKPGMQDFSDLDHMELPDVRKDGRFPIITEAFRRLIDQYGDVRGFGSGLAGPFTTAAELIGTEKFLIATVKNKEEVHRLLQFTTDCIVQCCRDLNEMLGIKFMLSEPMGAKNLISKRQFKEFFLPYLEQAVRRMNEFQGSTGLHICGQTRDRWQEIADSGVSSFWMDNCESLKDFRDQFGGQVALTGNISPVDILKNGAPEEIETEIIRAIGEAGDNPMGYTLCPGCTTPMGTTKENMIAFMNAAAVYGKGARKGVMPKGMAGRL